MPDTTPGRWIKVYIAYTNAGATAATDRTDAIEQAWDGGEMGNLDALRVVEVSLRLPPIADAQVAIDVPEESALNIEVKP